MRSDEIRERGRRAPELLQGEAVAEVAGSDAAVLLGERQAEESERRHLSHDLARDLVVVLDLLLDRLQSCLDEVAHGAREEPQLFRDVEVHHASPTWIAAMPRLSRS